jgi:hypothetical protein
VISCGYTDEIKEVYMKNLTKLLGIIALVAVIGFSLTGCPPEPEPIPDHTGTITAFGKTAKVTGDASISTADFNTAKGKLEEIMSTLENEADQLPLPWKTLLPIMMDRGITIVIGNAAPAIIGGALRVGVDYLKPNDTTTIARAILNLIDNGAFGYMVSFDAAQGTWADGTTRIIQIVTAGGKATKPATDPTREPNDTYTFGYWVIAAGSWEDTVVFDFNTPITSHLYLWAKWEW